jgi:hypothetical protein
MLLKEFFSVPSVKDNDPRLGFDKDSKTEKEKLSNEIFWYILDHDKLHKKHFMPIAQDMHEAIKSGKLDRNKYTECWMPMVREGCLDYHEEKKMAGNPKKMFDEDFCKEICEKLAEQYIEDIRKGEYKLGK